MALQSKAAGPIPVCAHSGCGRDAGAFASVRAAPRAPCGTIPAMLMYPQIDPVALQIGPLAVHWYGITYLVAFGLFMLLGVLRLRHAPFAALRGARRLRIDGHDLVPRRAEVCRGRQPPWR